MRSQSYSDRMRDAIIGPRVKPTNPSSQGAAMTQPRMASRRRKVRRRDSMAGVCSPCLSGHAGVTPRGAYPAIRTNGLPAARGMGQNGPAGDSASRLCGLKTLPVGCKLPLDR